MTRKHMAPAALLLLTSMPGMLPAVNYNFLDQAPVRFLTDADRILLSDTIGDVLDNAQDGEGRDWRGEDSANSGTVTAVRSFTKDDHPCRRIEIVTLARQATTGRGSSRMELCKIGGEWKILTIPQ